jgi:hypothetical protein
MYRLSSAWRALILCVAAAAQVYVRENFLGDVHLLRYAGLIGEA